MGVFCGEPGFCGEHVMWVRGKPGQEDGENEPWSQPAPSEPTLASHLLWGLGQVTHHLPMRMTEACHLGML